jgi:LmbE family N-acetylglucosaminyl deacetylase
VKKRLIIAPHADDEALGCGGLIAKYGEDVAVAVLADKSDGRLHEFEQSRKVLGYKVWRGPRFSTGQLMMHSRSVTGWLDEIIADLKPDELYLPTPGAHQDHLAAYECGLRAARKSYSAKNWFVPTVLLYEVPSYISDLYSIPYTWNRYLALSDEEMDRKCEAIAAYGSQKNGSFDPSELARDHAAHLGGRVKKRYVEQFAVVRDVID